MTRSEDYTPISKIAMDQTPIPKITEGQRRRWIREVEARVVGVERDELVAMVLGVVA